MVPALPPLSRQSLDNLASQGLLYGLTGVDQRGRSMVILFISRLPNTPSKMAIQHWPSWRFAPVAEGPSAIKILGSQLKVHWLALNPRLYSH